MSLFEKIANLSVVNVIIISVILIVLRQLFFGFIPKEIREYKKDEIKSCKDAKIAKELKKEKLALYTADHKVFKEIAEFCESLAFAFLLVFLVIRPFFIQAYFIPSESMMPGLIVRDHLIAQKFMYFFTEPKFGNVVIFKAPNEAYVNNKDLKPYTPPSDKLKRFWDVVSGADTRPDFIKRVIGEPGDKVYIKHGCIKVNGNKEILIPEMKARFEIFKKDYGFIRLKEDGVYVDGEKVSEKAIKEALFLKPTDNIEIHPAEVYRNGKKLNEPYISEDCFEDYPNLKRIKFMGLVEPGPWLKKSKGEYYVEVPQGKYLVIGDNRNNSFDARYWGFLDRESIKGQAMFIFWPFNRVKIIH